MEKSDWVVINQDVPHGTVFVPLFFLLYVNDFSGSVSTNCHVIQFAVEAAFQCHAKKEANLKLEAEDVLNWTYQNMKPNKLTSNEDKIGVNGFMD